MYLVSAFRLQSTECTARAVCVAFWLVLPLREKERTLYGLVKTYNCVVFKNFQHKMLCILFKMSAACLLLKL